MAKEVRIGTAGLSNVLDYTVTYKDLSGPAVGAHFHGPSEPGKNAGIVIIVMVSIVRRNLDGVLNTQVTNTVRVEDVSLLALTLRPP